MVGGQYVCIISLQSYELKEFDLEHILDYADLVIDSHDGIGDCNHVIKHGRALQKQKFLSVIKHSSVLDLEDSIQATIFRGICKAEYKKQQKYTVEAEILPDNKVAYGL